MWESELWNNVKVSPSSSPASLLKKNIKKDSHELSETAVKTSPAKKTPAKRLNLYKIECKGELSEKWFLRNDVGWWTKVNFAGGLWAIKMSREWLGTDSNLIIPFHSEIYSIFSLSTSLFDVFCLWDLAVKRAKKFLHVSKWEASRKRRVYLRLNRFCGKRPCESFPQLSVGG